MLNQLRSAWTLSSITSKAAVVAVVVVLIVLAVGLTQRIVSGYKDGQADKAIADRVIAVAKHISTTYPCAVGTSEDKLKLLSVAVQVVKMVEYF